MGQQRAESRRRHRQGAEGQEPLFAQSELDMCRNQEQRVGTAESQGKGQLRKLRAESAESAKPRRKRACFYSIPMGSSTESPASVGCGGGSGQE